MIPYLKTKSLLLAMLFGIIIFSCLQYISATPPVTTIQYYSQGYSISDEKLGTLPINTNLQYNFYVTNISNGYIIDNTSTTCHFDLSNMTGILFSTNATYSYPHWQVHINKSNLTKSGVYPYSILCVNSDLGGSLSGAFELTPTGIDVTTGRAIIGMSLEFMMFFIFLICLIFFIKYDNLLIKVGSFGMGYIMLIIVTYNAWRIASTLLLSTDFAGSIFRTLFLVLMIGAFPLLIAGFVYYFLMLWKIKEIQRLMDKGFSEDEATRRSNRRNK